MLERDGRTFQLIDTAGLRRKRKQRQGIEYYSELRALEAAERADVALVLIDAGEGIVEGDLAAADVARKAQCSTLDRALEVGPLAGDDRGRPPRAPAPAAPAAAVHHDLGEDRPRHLARARQGRRALRQARGPHPDRRAEPLPRRAEGGAASRRRKGSKRLNLLYGAQVTTRPPRFRFTVNDTSLVTRDYGYWVENELRERFELEGVPVAIDFRPPLVRGGRA